MKIHSMKHSYLAPQYHLPELPRLNGPTEFNWASGVNKGAKDAKIK